MNARKLTGETPPEIALLTAEAPSNVFEMLCVLVEGRLSREINALPLQQPAPDQPSLWRKVRGAIKIKQRIIARMHALLVPNTHTVVLHDTHSQDFIRYVLRNRPELPLDFFPAGDHPLLRHFAINKLLFAGVRVFETSDLYP